MNTKQQLQNHLMTLKLRTTGEQLDNHLKTASANQLSHLDFLEQVLAEEVAAFTERAINRRIAHAKFPVIKTIDTFEWAFPDEINRQQVQHLMQLDFLTDHTNLIFVGRAGVGKSHLATAIARQACLANKSVLHTTAFHMINDLTASQASLTFNQALRKYTRPNLLYIDELGYLPIDKHGADLIFQVINGRYERVSTILTTNRVFKDWPAAIFDNDATLTTALLDRLLHHVEVITIKGPSYRTHRQKLYEE
ncbi:MAG: ATP-binding protein [Planctomycetes bacterium]|nr:ATP-binding protein [Planctomycetota bacterium]